MYKISQFSKLSGLTAKTLRYYDDEGILQPSCRNTANQYRYYNDEDLKKALLIRHLRSLDFSIAEIKDVIKTVETEDDLTYILQEKIRFIEKNISKEKELIQKISLSTSSFGIGHKNNNYKIDHLTVPAISVASVRFTGKYSDLDTYVPLLYKAVKNNGDGKHFNLYYDGECVETADIELCIPVKKHITDKLVTCRTLPGIAAVHTTHYGSYDTLFLAYKALFEYVNTHQLKILTPSREIYTKCPGFIFRGNPANYVTEILLPYETDEKESL